MQKRKIYKPTLKEITTIVINSQLIEGYKKSTQDIKVKTKEIIKKYGIKVSI